MEDGKIMKATAVVLGLAVPLVLAALFADVGRGSLVRPAQAQGDAFDGHWVGSGRNAQASARNRCGDGPLVDMTIQDGAARAVFKLTVPKGLTSSIKMHVIPMEGSVGSDGKLTLSDQQSNAMADLSADSGSGEGSWEIGSLACQGSFQVRRKP